MLSNIQNVLLNTSFWKAILSTICLILLGFLLRRKNILKEGSEKVVSVLLLKVGIPALAFCSFMTDFDLEKGKTSFVLLILSFLLYLGLMVLGHFLFRSQKKASKDIFTCILMLGQVSFFALPVLEMLYGDEVLLYVNMITLSFRIFLYGYAGTILSSEDNGENELNKTSFWAKLKKIFVNPIMIAMILGLLIWISQPIFWKVQIEDTQVSLLRIDQTLPALYYPLQMLKNIATPLAMILIGMNMAKLKLQDAFADRMGWLLAIGRSILAPILSGIVALLLLLCGILPKDSLVFATILIYAGSPVSAVLASFATQYNIEPYHTSTAIFLSTLLSVLTIPVFVIIASLI